MMAFTLLPSGAPESVVVNAWHAGLRLGIKPLRVPLAARIFGRRVVARDGNVRVLALAWSGHLFVVRCELDG